jgi:hypothetical protein
MSSMSIEKSLNRASQFMDAIDAKMDGIKLPGEIKARVFFGLIHLSLEHFGAIIVLVKQKLSASAAALIRPQFEATIRALYFQECAREKEITAFVEGNEPITLKEMIDKLELQLQNTGCSFVSYYQNTKRIMHGFTHGGFEQIGRRYSETDLINSFTDNEIETMIAGAQVIACLSVSCAAAVAGKDELAKEFIMEFGKYEKKT